MVKRKDKTKGYKYQLLYLLKKLPYEDYETAKKFLALRAGVHPTTFKQWIYIKEDSNREIPGTALVLLADYFGVTVAELFTNKIPECNRQAMIEFNKSKNLGS